MKELEKKIKTTKNIKLIIKIQSIYRGIINRQKLEQKFKITIKKNLITRTPISSFSKEVIFSKKNIKNLFDKYPLLQIYKEDPPICK